MAERRSGHGIHVSYAAPNREVLSPGLCGLLKFVAVDSEAGSGRSVDEQQMDCGGRRRRDCA